jgi:hypothetical protein
MFTYLISEKEAQLRVEGDIAHGPPGLGEAIYVKQPV